MVHVLLLILKVLGITLLILLGIVLLMILLLALVPFYYTIDAEYYGDVKAVGRMRWLCFVLDFKGAYGNNKFLYYLKSFGFTISTNDENDKHYHKGLEEDEVSTKEAEEYQVPVKVVEDDFDSFVAEQKTADTAGTEVTQLPVKQEGGKASETDNRFITDEASNQAAPKQGILAKINSKVQAGMEWVTSIPMRIHYKISEILSRILDFLANIKENISRLIDKRNEIVKKVSQTKEFLQKSYTKLAWKHLKQSLFRLWKHVRPRKYHGIVRFGMEDPATTGQVLGVAAMLMPLYKEHIVVAPDFEQQIFEGEIYAKGRVQIGFFAIWILKLLLNRNMMKTIQEARTILGGNK